MWSQIIRSNPLEKFRKSPFRRKFFLDQRDLNLIDRFGLEQIKEHALNILNKSIRIRPINDGKQTPYHGHPVFKAQHATAVCCRKCIEKWHGFPRNKTLDNNEIKFLASVIHKWIQKEYRKRSEIISFKANMIKIL